MNGVLSQWESKPRSFFGLLGNPENRRIRDFQAAVERLGMPRPECVSYEDFLRAPHALPGGCELLRIDSPGENANVAKELIKLGGGPPDVTLEFGEIGFLREQHLGYCTVLDWIEQTGISCVNSPAEIRVMFDKWQSHQRFVQDGVSRPPAELAPGEPSAFLGFIKGRKTGSLFIKPLHGSSGSGVCALRWAIGHQQLTSPLRIQARNGEAILVNSLKVQTYTSLADIELILSILLPQGMIAEKWIPKLTLPGGAVDLRVLVIKGEARHWVVRQSRHPVTNLHLGNQRGDGERLLNFIGEANLRTAFRMAEKAAACFPHSLYAGVDILLDTRRRPFVAEINAFGDLLPRLTHRGETAYTAIAKACLARLPEPVHA